jgi:hypothetical protein
MGGGYRKRGEASTGEREEEKAECAEERQRRKNLKQRARR